MNKIGASDTAPSVPASPFKAALRAAVSDFKSIALLIGGASAIVIAYFALRGRLGLPEPWLTVVSLCPVGIFLIFYVVPEWRKAQKKRDLDALSVRGKVKRPGYFRLTPYTESDAKIFARPDNADKLAIEWIMKSTDLIIYIYGHSGVGKSSLLDAAIIPALKKQSPPWTVLQVRLQINPLGAIKAALQTPGVIWRNPPRYEDLDAFDLIERAERYVREQGRRFLVVFDQFEELFILLADEERQQFATLLGRLSERTNVELKLLFSLRAEYLSDLISLGLPFPTIGRNCFEVRPFTRAQAQDFLDGSGLQIGPVLGAKILAEVAKIEDMPDRVRPIVLNMISLVIASFQGSLPKGIEPGRLLSGYVSRAISQKDIAAYAPNVLGPLVTTVGTKSPQPLSAIAVDADLAPSVVRGCLIRLADSGIVRPLDDQRWEIAHDFVARLIQPLLQNWRKSTWDKARPILGPAAFAAWVLTIGVALVATPYVKNSFALARLAQAGLVLTTGDEIETTKLFYTLDETELNNVLPYLDWLSQQSVSLTIHYDNRDPEPDQTPIVSTFNGWPNLKSLTGITLEAKQMKDLMGMPEFPNLRRLTLRAYDLKTLNGMSALPKLTELNIQSGLIEDNTTEFRLTGFRVLPNLETLQVFGIGDLAGLPSLPKLKHLAVRSLASTNVTEDEQRVDEITTIPQLPALQTLELRSAFDFSRSPRQESLVELIAENRPLSQNKFPSWFKLKRVSAVLASQADIDALSKIAPNLEQAALFLRFGSTQAGNWSSIEKKQSLQKLELMGDCSQLSFLSKLAGLSEVTISFDTDRYHLRGSTSGDIDYASLAELPPQVIITMVVYDIPSALPEVLRSRIKFDFLPSKA